MTKHNPNHYPAPRLKTSITPAEREEIDRAAQALADHKRLRPSNQDLLALTKWANEHDLLKTSLEIVTKTTNVWIPVERVS